MYTINFSSKWYYHQITDQKNASKAPPYAPTLELQSPCYPFQHKSFVATSTLNFLNPCFFIYLKLKNNNRHICKNAKCFRSPLTNLKSLYKWSISIAPKITLDPLKRAFLAKEWNTFHPKGKRLGWLHLKGLSQLRMWIILAWTIDTTQHKIVVAIDTSSHKLDIEIG